MSDCHNRVVPTLTALGVGAVLTAAALAAEAQGASNRGAAAAAQAQRPAVTLPSQATSRTLPPQASGVTLPSQARNAPAEASQDGLATAQENIGSDFARQVVSGELSGKDIAVDRADEEAKAIVEAAGDDLDGRAVAEEKRGESLPDGAPKDEDPTE